MSDNIYSVSQLNQSVRLMLENQLGQVWLSGEISNFTQPVSGHWYLSLKDENAQVRCAMFRIKNLRVGFRPSNGMQVLVRANVSLYEPRGDYQLIIESMHLAGEGLLMQQFEALKRKLAAEGLFAQNHKKNLPHFSKAVGIITSKTGAALQDILHILQRRDPSLKVIIYPTAVQGKEAAAEITQMIEIANRRQEVDVLIVGRGGGSLEDLWCFNEEIVARAIFHSATPIISAVGHETDITIADFIADLRAPTPSAAAELVSRDQTELLQQLQYRQQRIEIALDRIFIEKKRQLQHLFLRLQNQHPQAQLRIQQQLIAQLRHRLQQSLCHRWQKTAENLTALSARLYKNPLPLKLQQQEQQLVQLKVRLNSEMNLKLGLQQKQLAHLCGKLDSLSPLKVLARGYSITQNQHNRTITSIHAVNIGEQIQTRVADGIIISQINRLEKK
ncbi:exodeoxyribonuclease VII large subunit [Aggregatibacter actinomycetemcomitans serotype e str. SC936]|uniref:exodeoxyribonuclease VII large subunit n=1 Tax=Aggregatibacter actinomycetemcomitans TaxID=714 RepID=UPI00077E5B53|nr:exodeoxyribonuclease VII large subunit [Aggregatibacter actinomycetemcomitans]KYK76017.1 exodeoxyribonuclease VII large subunit [Aggregatibacter actinomycetemcomitans serotype e str. SA3096]KYK81782.1 exodeoxyribonuclease VII large subunit [Aggregatibacter actinomycetemcomitans serotype e str. SC936]KYK93213.1 exodeoxyribonuclease VII large subunit [Aggregatibacter actinomycetemcomitans serotype e str. ANH9776]TYB21762.1 exodeoxyribonuclease VII large subunit [Aggregatibacter actinomycetemco